MGLCSSTYRLVGRSHPALKSPFPLFQESWELPARTEGDQLSPEVLIWGEARGSAGAPQRPRAGLSPTP